MVWPILSCWLVLIYFGRRSINYLLITSHLRSTTSCSLLIRQDSSNVQIIILDDSPGSTDNKNLHWSNEMAQHWHLLCYMSLVVGSLTHFESTEVTNYISWRLYMNFIESTIKYVISLVMKAWTVSIKKVFFKFCDLTCQQSPPVQLSASLLKCGQ